MQAITTVGLDIAKSSFPGSQCASSSRAHACRRHCGRQETRASMSSNAGCSAIRHDARGTAFATRAVSCSAAPSEGFQVIT